MTIATTYPNGQVLVSSALTVDQINKLIQALTFGMIGLPDTDLSLVRVDWQTEGQPFENAKYDICYLACTPQDVEYSRVRNQTLSQSGSTLTETWTYTKGWRIAWCFYGPNSEDRARMVRSAMFMDYFNDQLNLGQLFPVPDPPEVVRAPEHINGQWFERADFHIIMYENVTETIQDGIATSVENKVYLPTSPDASHPAADFTVEA